MNKYVIAKIFADKKLFKEHFTWIIAKHKDMIC